MTKKHKYDNVVVRNRLHKNQKHYMNTISTERPSATELETTSHELVSGKSVDEIILHTKSEIPPLTAEVLSSIDALDRLGSSESNPLQACEVASTIGVFTGIKPASLVVDLHIGNEKKRSEYEEIVSRLGLSMARVPEKNYWIVSRHQEIIDELSTTLDRYHQGNHGDDATEHRIGKLLGYPETATSYFIERWNSMDTPGELPVVDVDLLSDDEPFVQIVLSPDNYEAELEGYVRPLKRAVKELAPKSYELIMNEHIGAKRTRFGSKVLQRLGVKKIKH